MDTINEQSKSLPDQSREATIRGGENSSKLDHHRNSQVAAGSDGSSSQSQPIRTSGTISEGINQHQSESSGVPSGGKLIDQLEEFFNGYLEYVQAHEQRLEARLDDNRTHQHKMNEQFEVLKQSLFQLVEPKPNTTEEEK